MGETYDWRLSIANMERRDGYFTRLKLRIEMLHGLNKEKVHCAFHHAPAYSASSVNRHCVVAEPLPRVRTQQPQELVRGSVRRG